MAQKTDKIEPNNSKDKILVQIGEQRKEWVTNVATLSNCPQAEVIRVLVDQASVEDPESFVIKMEKFKLKMKLQDLEQREESIKREKAETVRALESRENRAERGEALLPQ